MDCRVGSGIIVVVIIVIIFVVVVIFYIITIIINIIYLFYWGRGGVVLNLLISVHIYELDLHRTALLNTSW